MNPTDIPGRNDAYPSPARDLHKPGCPICTEHKTEYLFVVHGLPVVRCPRCSLVSLQPQPDESRIRAFYQRFEKGSHLHGDLTDSVTERRAALDYHKILVEMGMKGGNILLVAPENHPFALEASDYGKKIARHLSIQQAVEMQSLVCAELPGGYDAAVILFQLEKAPDPAALLKKVHAALAPDGILLTTTPSLGNWPARFFGEQWTEWRPENLFYFDQNSITALLVRCGFGAIFIEPEQRYYNLQHIYERSASFPKTGLTRAVKLAYRVAPAALRSRRIRLGTSGMIVTAQKRPLRETPLLSIIVPLYNEMTTFPAMMQALLSKKVAGVEREIIIVESNSTDGSRALAQSFASHPEVRLVLQDRPLGKGNAVREGLAASRGDILLIQDADLEYDIHDYDILLEPLLNYSALFVLGARHGGKWKMRRFTNQPVMSAYFNSGHLFFTGVINLLYGQHMKDPFTMYKVFRRECLEGLTFECNRFDFDHELVIKLVRKGYTPLEIPVNYSSRSFSEGKKAGVGMDPLVWLWTDIRLRFGKVYRRVKR